MIIHYGKTITIKEEYSIVLEYADGGNLQEYIEHLEENNLLMPEKDATLIFIQIVRGLRAIHKKKIIHRDLKVMSTY